MRLNPEQLAARLAKGLAPVYVVHGDEPLLVQEASDAIRAAAREQGYGERECLTAEAGFDWNALRICSDSLSLFAVRRLIELRLEAAKPGEAGAKALQGYAARPADDSVLLVICGKLDAAAQRAAWLAALDRVGVLVQVRPVEAAQLPAWIGQRMRSRGLRPTAEAVALLAERTEGNLLAAAQEIEKLGLLFGAGPLTAERLLEAVGDSARYSIYDLVDAALEGRAARAARILKGLREEGVEAVLVSWVLQREIRLLSQIAFEVGAGAPLEAVLARNRVWDRRKPLVGRAVRRLTPSVCRGLLRDCARVDRLIKGVEQGDPWDELLTLSLRLAGREILVDIVTSG